MTQTAFPLKLTVTVRSSDRISEIAPPILSDELKQWFTDVGLPDFELEWREVKEDHPAYEQFSKWMNLSTTRPENQRVVLDTWVVFKNKKDATLFKLTWGQYAGS